MSGRKSCIECPREFTADDVIISSHAIDRYQERAPGAKQTRINERILQTITQGRRSDQNPDLKLELAPWLIYFKEFRDDGRRVVLFRQDSSPLVCLVAAARHASATSQQVVVLTCFWADHRIEHRLNSKEMKALNRLEAAIASLPDYLSIRVEDGHLSVFKGSDLAREIRINTPFVNLDVGDESPAGSMEPTSLVRNK